MKLRLFDVREFTDESYKKALALLSRERQEKLGRMREQAARLSAAGELLARQLLAEASGMTPGAIVISREPSGKPFAPELPFHFSISHSGDLAACAIHTAPIGLDLQRLGAIRPGVLRKVYSPEEQAYVLSDPAAQEERFARLWCMKEAAGKKLGTGVFASDRFVCSFCDGEPVLEAGEHRFLIPEAPEGYAMALCL